VTVDNVDILYIKRMTYVGYRNINIVDMIFGLNNYKLFKTTFTHTIWKIQCG
jgi:hypothetical protein